MRSADIKVGETYAIERWDGVNQGVVIAIGVKRHLENNGYWTNKTRNDGIQVVFETWPHSTEAVVPPVRVKKPWAEYLDERDAIAKEADNLQRQQDEHLSQQAKKAKVLADAMLPVLPDHELVRVVAEGMTRSSQMLVSGRITVSFAEMARILGVELPGGEQS